MTIVSSFQSLNLFSSLPSTPPPNNPTSFSTPAPSPPIPIPKHPPPLKKSNTSQTTPTTPSPAFKHPHRKSHYYKPVKPGQVIPADGDRSVIIGESGVSYLLPGAPFEFQFSYSETPNVKPLAMREPAFLPFGPPTMPRPWTGKKPLQKSKKNIPLFDSFDPPTPGKKGVKRVEMPGPFQLGKFPKEGKTREEILGEPLKDWEVKMLIKPHLSDNRQVNLGRDGLTHNMLELVHSHWKRRRVCKVKCKGIPTVDMDNVCRHLEEKTGGEIIYRSGGVVYLFRGRNYNYRTRPQYPVMLWKPAAPVYPKLIQEAPEGLTNAEADDFRRKGKNLLPICRLAKNGVYITLVREVRTAFEVSTLVKIDCTGLEPSDYKKLGAKLKDLVPCVLLSFDDEQILMWRGQNWKSMYPNTPSNSFSAASDSNDSGKSDDDCHKDKVVTSSPKMISLWKNAIESSKAILLDEIDLGPDALLSKVEEFNTISQATEHSYPALITSSENGTNNSMSAFEDDSASGNFNDGYSDDDYSEEYYNSDSLEEVETVETEIPIGSLPVDQLVERESQSGMR